MKNKLINTLMLAGIISFTLVGCNSGASGSVSNSAQNSQSAGNNVTQSTLTSAPVIGSVNLPNTINMLGGDIIDTIIDPSSGVAKIGTQLLGLLTGSVFPSKPSQSQLQQLEAQNAQMFAQIQSNLQNINTELNAQGTLLLGIQNSIYQDQQIDTQLAISQAQNQLQIMLNQLNSYISLALPQEQANQVNALLNNAESGTIPESAIAVLMKDTGTMVSRVQGINSLDSLEITLAGDNATSYSVNNPALHNNPESYGTASNTQLIASLQAAYNSYVSQSNGSTNLFQNQLAWNNTVDSTILQLMQNLNTAYRIDQLRLFLSMNLKTKISPPASIYYGDLNNYATASADLAYAYQQRFAFLMYLDNLYKTNFWNNFMGVLGNGLSQSCNLNNTYLSSLSNGSSLGSWNGTNLTISCNGGTFQSQGQNIQPVINTNFTPSLPCNTNSNGVYGDLTVTKAGYIICGTNSNDWNNETDQYGNQTGNNNINNTMAAANNGTFAPNIAQSQYSWAYIFVPLPAYYLGTMQAILPDYNNGTTGFSVMGGSGSGIFDITQPGSIGTVAQNVQTVPRGTYDMEGPLNVINVYYSNSLVVRSLPTIYYDNYHALMLQATCATIPGTGSGTGCGIAFACIPGLSDCTNALDGSTATLNDMNLSVTRTNDSIQFANGDNLQLTLANINQPNNAGLATIQYSN
ncbi:MAG: hypothetical protein E6Q32_02045 [Neisseriales bacterium]|nr:MAG: hypothetical protein E6Q32_02045 [Neisseriales bacterium]